MITFYKTKIFVGIFLLAIWVNGYADKPYQDENRITYTEKVLRAFDETKLSNLLNTYRYINVVDINNCRSSVSDLQVKCLLSHAEKNCNELPNQKQKRACEFYSDVIITNKLSEKAFISTSERYRISNMKEYSFRTAFENRLLQKYARIVTQFSLSNAANCENNDFHCLALALDQFCLDYTNSNSLSWQYCMSASLWFIGTSSK